MRAQGRCGAVVAILQLFLVMAGLQLSLGALAAEPQVPQELKPWIPWVLENNPSLNCPIIKGKTECIWPGELTLEVWDTKGSLNFGLRVDRKIAVPLPGGKSLWPQRVYVNGRSAPVIDVNGLPMVTLEEGKHRITAEYPWAKIPRGIRIPPRTGLVRLYMKGYRVERPQMEGDVLKLVESTEAETVSQKIEIDVSPKIVDGVPVRVQTRLQLRASGSPRELNLGGVLIPSTRPVSLKADMPARLTPAGELVVQVRAGSYQISFDALFPSAVTEVKAPMVSDPWPRSETWVVQSNDEVRAVNVTGAAAVDASRTSLKSDWHSLPAFLLKAGEGLSFTELRRGEPQAAASRLTLQRELWLDANGSGLTIRDRFSGDLREPWRLDMLAPVLLGHVNVSGSDAVITKSNEGLSGVEIRTEQLKLTAESRLEERSGTMPAVGWNTDVQSLNTRLHLPPGWSLVHATGVDSVPGSAFKRWSSTRHLLCVDRHHGCCQVGWGAPWCVGLFGSFPVSASG